MIMAIRSDQHALLRAFDRQTFAETVTWLRDYRDRVNRETCDKHVELLSRLKKKAVTDGDQLTAKAVWCLETIYSIQRQYVAAVQGMRTGQFQQAWYLLDRCDIEGSFLRKHFADDREEFGIQHALIHVRRFQDLYPYNWGISPEFLYKEIRCSVCDEKITLRSDCGHETGEIYDGEMCSREISSIDILGVSIVANPVQKYSVIFPNGDDDDRFSLPQYVATALNNPWDAWSCQIEDRRQHHPAFQNLGRNEPCACGSGVKYKRCCANKETVFPHYRVTLSEHPKAELPQLVIHTRRP